MNIRVLSENTDVNLFKIPTLPMQQNKNLLTKPNSCFVRKNNNKHFIVHSHPVWTCSQDPQDSDHVYKPANPQTHDVTHLDSHTNSKWVRRQVLETRNTPQAPVSHGCHQKCFCAAYHNLHTGSVIFTRQILYQSVGRNFYADFTAIDRTHIAVKAPSWDEFVSNKRKHFHSLNVQIICAAQMLLTNKVARWPGSMHNSFILTSSIVGNYGIIFVPKELQQNFPNKQEIKRKKKD